METFHIFHLAASWSRRLPPSQILPPIESSSSPVSPIHHLPVTPSVTAEHIKSGHIEHKHATDSQIRAASVQMIFAARLSQDFINPDHVREIEIWSGKAVLQALSRFDIEPKVGVHCYGISEKSYACCHRNSTQRRVASGT